jgi:hypothetical protein
MSRFIVFVLCSAAIVQLGAAAPAASNEISADRAWKLAQTYYMRYFGDCGGVGEIVARGGSWDAPVHFGYAGTFEGYIHVDRHTGAVSYPGRPTWSAASLDQWFASLTKPRKAP